MVTIDLKRSRAPRIFIEGRFLVYDLSKLQISVFKLTKMYVGMNCLGKSDRDLRRLTSTLKNSIRGRELEIEGTKTTSPQGLKFNWQSLVGKRMPAHVRENPTKR